MNRASEIGVEILFCSHRRQWTTYYHHGWRQENIFVPWVRQTKDSVRIYVLLGEQDHHLGLLEAMHAEGLGLFSHLYGLLSSLVGERGALGLLTIPTSAAYALLAREPLAHGWMRAREAISGHGSVEQPA